MALAVSRSCVSPVLFAQRDSRARLSSRFAPIRGKPRLCVRMFCFITVPIPAMGRLLLRPRSRCSDSEFVKLSPRLLSAFTPDQVGDWLYRRRVRQDATG